MSPKNDQRFIYSLHSRFQVILDSMSEDNREAFQLNAEEQTLSDQHKACEDHRGVAVCLPNLVGQCLR